MKQLLTWLKAKAREWCAPDYGALSHDVDHLSAVVRGYEGEVRRLKLALKIPFKAQESDSAPAWTPEDRQHWKKFLATTTGERLAQTINFWSQVEARKAALRPDKHEYACGGAAGWHLAGDFMLNKLSADLPLQTEDDTTQGKGAAGARERMAP